MTYDGRCTGMGQGCAAACMGQGCAAAWRTTRGRAPGHAVCDCVRMDIRPQATTEWTRLAELIDDIDIAMLTTVEPDGALRSRPLRTLQMDEEGGLWFMTSISSPKIGEMDEHRRVSLSYCRPARERYVWASGVTQILRDDAKARELWTMELRPWLPDGRDDPEAVLLKITVEEAEYWDASRREVLPLIGGPRTPRNVRLKA